MVRETHKRAPAGAAFIGQRGAELARQFDP